MKKEKLIELLDSNADIVLLDIREAEELIDLPTIPGAIHMPMGRVFIETSKGNLPINKHIIVFCRTGRRAGIIQQELQAAGYTIDSIDGGLNEFVSTK